MSNPFVGEIRMFGFTFAPKGWAFCDGQILPISQNTALFSLLGTQYGGNGTSNFALPDLQARFVIGQGPGPGLTPRVMGETGGSSSVTLLNAEMAAHAHLLPVSSLPADRSNATGNYLAIPPDPVYVNGAGNTSTFPLTAQPVGGGLPHNNVSPTSRSISASPCRASFLPATERAPSPVHPWPPARISSDRCNSGAQAHSLRSPLRRPRSRRPPRIPSPMSTIRAPAHCAPR